MGKAKGGIDYLENQTQFEEDRFIDSDLMDQMLQETLEFVSEEKQEVASLSLEILIGSTEVPAEQIHQYREGDLITLDQELSEPVTLTTAEGQIFKGKLGKLKEHYAIRLVKS